jgi:hypothetical protein
MKRTSILILLAAALASAAPAAYAQTGNLAHLLFNTGVNAAKAVLTDGAPDPHYTLFSVPAGSPSTALKMSAHPNWLPNTSASAWIGPYVNGQTTAHAGTYKYSYQLDLTGYVPSTVVIKGRWSSDNDAQMFVNISLNNTPVSSIPSTAFQNWYLFTLNSGFVAGVNTLEFHVVNQPLASGGEPGQGTGNPTGLRVEFLEGNALPIPEPVFFQLGALAGMGGLGLLRLRRRS